MVVKVVAQKNVNQNEPRRKITDSQKQKSQKNKMPRRKIKNNDHVS